MIVHIPCDMLALYILQSGEDISALTECVCSSLVKAYLQPILSSRPSAIYLNVCYRRSAVPSEVFSTFAHDIVINSNGDPIMDSNGVSIKTPVAAADNICWVSPYHRAILTVFHTLLSRGIDLCGIAMNIIKDAGVSLFLSVRPSDNHGWVGMGTEFLDRNCLPADGRPDFSRPCVRNYFQNYISELLRNYDPDGIEVDWLRKMPVLPGEMLDDSSIISDYMRILRRTVSAFGNKKLAVRVYATVQKNLENAMDICGWIADGLIDSFTAENFYIPTNYEIPIDQWRQKIAERNINGNAYKLYCGSDWAVSCGLPFSHYMTPDLIRGFATSCLERGADDIYLFNLADCNAETTVMFDEEKQSLVSCIEARFAAAANPNHGARRYVYVSGCDHRYPIRITSGESKSITVYTGKPAEQYRLYLCSAEPNALSLRLNDHPMSALFDEPPIPGFEAPTTNEELPVRYCRKQFDQSVRFALPRSAEDIHYGYNTFLITNTDTEEISISWIEVQVQ